MSENKNLIAEDAIAKLQELVKNAPTCMFSTGLGKAPFHVCPMQVQEADYEGRLWFFSGADSTHNAQITADSRVQLIFANNPDMEFLTVYGTASISHDRAQIDRLWNRMVEAWFPEGKDDPNISLICVQPALAHYWDTEDGKLITMAKILTRAATGADIETGVEGDLNV
ncbi:pyridoxamine 5'-phosphate oxidase family protein [Luteolibacter algae]|uniref:Pyridoxamine 5'-phosphate oxidase family protein n=1 Tax=Luteolibacter algae TaxID=454151 RepID=A0ABW5D725_9BACT